MEIVMKKTADGRVLTPCVMFNPDGTLYNVGDIESINGIIIDDLPEPLTMKKFIEIQKWYDALKRETDPSE